MLPSDDPSPGATWIGAVVFAFGSGFATPLEEAEAPPNSEPAVLGKKLTRRREPFAAAAERLSLEWPPGGGAGGASPSFEECIDVGTEEDTQGPTLTTLVLLGKRIRC